MCCLSKDVCMSRAYGKQELEGRVDFRKFLNNSEKGCTNIWFKKF